MPQEVDRSIPFVDTHHHLWELGGLGYSWLEGPDAFDDASVLGDYEAIRADWGPDRLFREFHGQNVVASIHVEAAMSGSDPVAETAWLDRVHRSHGMPNAMVVASDLAAADAGALLDRHLDASDLVRGVRVPIPAEDQLPGFRNGLRELQSRGLSYDLNLEPGQHGTVLDLISSFPDLRFVLGHAGAPNTADPRTFDEWAARIVAVAEAENVACKISGMGMRDHHWTVSSIRPWVLHCIEAFGVQRSMFGTNWPVDVLYGTYDEQVDAYRSILAEAGFGEEQQHALLHGNAQRIYAL